MNIDEIISIQYPVFKFNALLNQLMASLIFFGSIALSSASNNDDNACDDNDSETRNIDERVKDFRPHFAIDVAW